MGFADGTTDRWEYCLEAGRLMQALDKNNSVLLDRYEVSKLSEKTSATIMNSSRLKFFRAFSHSGFQRVFIQCCMVVVTVVLLSCTYRPKEKRLAGMSGDNRVVATGYKKEGDTIRFKRLAVKESQLMVQAGKIFHSHLVMTQQQFNAVTKYDKSLGLSDSLLAAITEEGWAPRLAEGRDLMFIQIIPDFAMSTLDALGFINLRQSVESKIDNALLSGGAGEWVGGDMGAGANMLFEVDNWDKANEVAMKILKDEDLLDHVLIARRILISSDDWQYEIVYPVEFEGVFNDL